MGWLITRNKFLLIASCFFGIVGQVSFPAIAYFVHQTIERGLTAQNVSALVWWSLALVAVGLISAASIVGAERYGVHYDLDIVTRSITLTDRKAARLGNELHKKSDAGAVVSIGLQDAMALGDAAGYLGHFIGTFLSVLALSILLLQISVPLGLTILIGSIIVAVINGPLVSRLQQRQSTYREHVGDLSTSATDIVNGLRVLRGIGGEDRFRASYRKQSQDLLRTGLRIARPQASIRALIEGSVAVLIAAVVWVAARQAVSGVISTAEVIAAFTYASAMLLPVSMASGMLRSMVEGHVAAGKLSKFLRLHEPDGVRSPLPLPTDHRLYDPDSELQTMKGLTVVVTANDDEAVAIFERFCSYRATEATIGSIPVNRLDRADLRRTVLLADHDAYLYAGTIADNVSPHSASTTRHALRTAHADDIISSLSDGIDTRVGNQIRTLSGGQRQRLRLARAVATDVPILLLPNPTSAVDSHTEAAIAERVYQFRRDLTTVVVSTSPLWLSRADRVAYLRDGKIIDSGTHHEVAQRQHDYQHLVSRENR